MEDREEMARLLRQIHEAARVLSTCGDGSIEPRASEILGLSYAMLWAETPFDVIGSSLEYE